MKRKPLSGDYPSTIPELRKLVTKLDVHLFHALLQRNKLRDACEALLKEFVTAAAYPDFEADPDRFIAMATAETLARVALTCRTNRIPNP